MADQAFKNSDKTIVEKRVAHAGDKSRKAVKDMRAGLGAKAGTSTNPGASFAKDMLRKHTKLQHRVLLTVSFMLAAGAAVAQYSLSTIIATAWALIAILVVAGTVFASRKFLSSGPEGRSNGDWNKIFLGFELAFGLVWAGLFAIHPLQGPDGTVLVVAFSGTIIVAALALLKARYLTFGVLYSAAPAIAVVVVRLALEPTIPSIAMAVLIIATLLFIQWIAGLMRAAHIDYLRSQAERDQLIMELEASRSISEEARRRAEEANLAKSRFLATMSHELRTPLNAILGFSEVMSNEVMGPINNTHYKEYLGDIHRSGAHLLKLINEILDLSRVEAGRYELHEEATNLAHAAEESQQMIKLKASEKNVAIIMQIQPELPQIWADARAVRQVILNLLSNALKFTPSGGTIWLKVGWTAGGGQYVAIKDTGPGIPEDEIPIVLSSFGQGSIAIKSAEQGTGLGLPIVQALVHMHDGSFNLTSKLREGTEVIATFPKSRVMEVMSPVAVDTNEPNTARNGLRRQVQAPAMST